MGAWLDSDRQRDLAGARILVADDSPTVRLMARALLEQCGCIVRAVSSGEEAFEACWREPFDLVVSDLTMGTVGGAQLCRLLRSAPQTASIPVVMLTAADHQRNRFWARNAGANGLVPKERIQSELIAVVAGALASREGGRTPQSAGPRLEGWTARTGMALPRLSGLLDELLFGAVLSREVHRLVAHLDDRRALLRAMVSLAGELIDAAYIVASTRESSVPAEHAVLARGPWPAGDAGEALDALGIPPSDRTGVVVEGAGALGMIAPGEVLSLPIEVAGEALGTLRAFAPERARISARDRDTLELLARESALIVKSALLAEHARVLARVDALTGLANRGAAHERLVHEIERVRRHGGALSVALCDIDRFKQVNDQFGHGAGDEVLRAVSAAIRSATREVDLVGRWGGEEIIAVLPEATETGGRIAAERIRASVEGLSSFSPGPERVTISVGVAAWAGESAEDLVARADRGLYRAKRRGRNRVEVELPSCVRVPEKTSVSDTTPDGLPRLS